MADEEKEDAISPDKSQSNDAQATVPEDGSIPETSGWLMKRSKISHKWKKQWFHLKNTDLLYGNEEGVTPKRIPLEGAEIAESNVDDKSHGFRIKPKDNKRVFYFYAENEEQQHNWMQAICFAKATGNTDKSEACVVQ